MVCPYSNLSVSDQKCIKDDERVGKTAKGIKKNVIKNHIKHEDYKNVLFNGKQLHHKMKTIRSQKHQLGSYEINNVYSVASMLHSRKWNNKLRLQALPNTRE